MKNYWKILNRCVSQDALDFKKYDSGCYPVENRLRRAKTELGRQTRLFAANQVRDC